MKFYKLLELGVDVNKTNGGGNNVLGIACKFIKNIDKTKGIINRIEKVHLNIVKVKKN